MLCLTLQQTSRKSSFLPLKCFAAVWGASIAGTELLLKCRDRVCAFAHRTPPGNRNTPIRGHSPILSISIALVAIKMQVAG